VDQFVPVGVDAGGDASGNRQPQVDAFGACVALEVLDDLADDPQQVDGPRFHVLHAGFQARVVEQSVDKL
jgi:hypothetical protein